MKSRKVSAGFLIYKFVNDKLKVFIVHPGGPFWKDQDARAWSIPKGEVDDDDFSEKSLFETAKRELKEETGIIFPNVETIYLGEIEQKSGKIVHAFAFEGDWSGLLMCESFVEMEWPYKSRKKIRFPEVDKAGFFDVKTAKEKINPAQIEFIERLEKELLEE